MTASMQSYTSVDQAPRAIGTIERKDAEVTYPAQGKAKNNSDNESEALTHMY